MKRITFLIIAVFAFSFTHAQYLTEDFETAVPPAGWVDEAGTTNTGTTLWAQTTTEANGGLNSAFFNDGASGADRWLITSVIDLSGATAPRLTYFDNVNFASFADTHDVLVSTDYAGTGDPTVATWTTLNSVIGTEDTWVQNGPYALPVSATVYVAFHYIGDNSADWYIDDMLIEEAPACGEPSTLMANPTSTTDVDITWIAGGTETDWNYEYGVSPYAQDGSGTTGSVMTTPSLTLMGLTAGETYDIHIQAACGSTYATVQWTQPNVGESCATAFSAAVEVDCSTATPLSLDFDAGGSETLTSCDASGNTGYWVEVTTPANGSMNINLGGTATSVGVAIYDACGGTEVFCSNNALGATTELTGFSGSTAYYMYFWQDTASGIAEVCFEEISCVFPSNLGASVTSATTADISWDENNTPAATAWEYVVQAQGAGAPAGAGTATASNPTSLTALVEGDGYEFYVRADCGGSFSDWSGPFTWNQVVPPSNDECASPIALTVNADFGCGTVTPGTTVAATASGEDDAGTSGTPNNDVWFSFVATGPNHRVSLENVVAVVGTSTDMGMTVYDATGGCAGLVLSATSDPNTLNLTGLTATTTYYVRVYGWASGTTTAQTSFDVCVGTAPSCLEPSALGASGETETTADLDWTENSGATSWNIELVDITNGGTQMMTATNSGVTNPYTIMGLTGDTSYEYYVQTDCGGGDLSTWAGPFAFNTPPAAPACGGVFTDTGGSSATYSASEASTWTITPDNPGESVTITFTLVDIEVNATAAGNQDGCWDFMTIYNGPSNASPVLAQTLCGEESGDGGVPSVASSELNIGDAFTSTDASGALTIEFSSDSSVQETGWSADVTCAVLGVNDVEDPSAFTYYPNPVKNTLTLNAQNTIETITMYNMLGQEVLRATPNTVDSDLDMSSLQTGTYFVKVTIANITKTIRVIKQ